MEAAEFLRRRNALGLSQVKLANQLGRTPTTVARWERGEQPIPRYVELAMDGLEMQMKREQETR